MKTAAEVFDASLNGSAIRFRIAWLDFLIAILESLSVNKGPVYRALRFERDQTARARRDAIAELERRDTP